MNNNPVNTFLTYALGASVVLSLLFCYQTIKHTRELRQLAVSVSQLNQSRAQIQMLVSICLEYSKTNPSMDPLLETYGVKPKKEAKSGNK